jgi:hypothetical protein
MAMNSSTRLRIATRIHFALLRHFDEKVEVETLLRGGDEAREALWVCEASGSRELAALARALRNEPPAKTFSDTGFAATEFSVTGFGTTGFATTEFGETAVGELVEERSEPRASLFGKLDAMFR